MTVRGSNTRVAPELLEQVRRECKGSLCAHRNGQPSKTRQFVDLVGFGPEHNMGVYNNNVDTIERAFAERYFLCKDGEGFRPAFEVGPLSFRTSALEDFRANVMRHMPSLPRMTRRQVVAAYVGPKQRVYQQAYESLCVRSITERDARLSSFVKFEKQDVLKAPRVINPRSPRYNLLLGTYLKHAEKHFFKAINFAFGGRTPATVVKGVNADMSAEILRSKWDLFKDPVAVGLDASKFDMHVSQPALRYEHSFYTQLFPNSRELKWLLGLQLRNAGVARARDGHVRFEMVGTRSSGDLNTSLGNCLLMCGLIHAYLRERRVVAELANNGDDCVVILERADLTRFQNGLDVWFRRKGFAMQVEEPAFEFEQIEFCQTRPVHLSTGWRMVRNQYAVLTKDPMCLLSVPNVRVLRKWMDAVGQCGQVLASGVPVQSGFYDAFRREGVACSAGMVETVFKNRSQLQLGRGLTTAVVDARARVSYYYAFGVKPDEQVAMEAYFANLDFEAVMGESVPRAMLVVAPGPNIVTT